MRPVTLVVLAVLGAAALGAGLLLAPRDAPAPAAPGLAFPGLAARLPEVARVEITQGGKALAIAQHGDGRSWGLVERDFYPVQVAKLRALLTGLADLRLVETRSADPADYPKLGVEDPAPTGAGSALVRLLDDKGQPVAALIVGHSRSFGRGAAADRVDVRRPDEAQSWLAEGRVEVEADPQQWLDRDVVNIDHARIAGITASRGDQTLAVARQGDALTLTEPAEHPKLDAAKVTDLGRALELLTFTDVRAGSALPGDALGRSAFHTTDGLTVEVDLSRAGADLWARFAASGEGAAKAEAERLTARLHDWLFQIGAWKEPALLPTLDGLKALALPAPTPGQSTPGQSTPGQSAPAPATPVPQ